MSRRTIQSPGVEIREIDLTQRPAEPLGTSVFIPGFSNQGPTDEIINVGTFSDFEEIYGKPTNAAERYFYHSVKQTFDSDANVYVSRLPYGSGDGTSEKYSALYFPVISPNTGTVSGLSANGAILVESGFTSEDTNSTLYIELITKNSNGDTVFTSTSANLTAAINNDGYISDSNITAQVSALTGHTFVAGTVYSTASALSGYASSLSASDYYIIGNPTLVELTQAQYNTINENNFTWSDNASAGATQTFSPTQFTGAGIIVLNTGKTSLNNNFEGYYVGLVDGVNSNPATDYDGAVKQYTSTSTGTKTPADYFEVPNTRLDYSLSAGYISNKSSVSKTLEDISKFSLQGADFIDTISIGIFKVRVTPFSNTDLKLTNFLAEGYTGSLNSYRKIQNENGGERKSFFLEDVEQNSPNIKILVNPYISKLAGDWTSNNSEAPTKFVRTHRTSGDLKFAAVQRGYQLDHTTESNFSGDQGIFGFGTFKEVKNTSKVIGSIPSKLDRIFRIAENVDLFNIDISIEAGLGTIFVNSKYSSDGNITAVSAFEDTAFLSLGSVANGTGFYTTNENMVAEGDAINIRDDYRSVFNTFEQFARETRKDHIFIADVLRNIVVQGDNEKVLNDKSKNFSQNVYWPIRHQFGSVNTNYATVYANWIKVYDAVSDNQVWVPFSGNAAGLYARNDANFAPWYAPAGYTRGVVTGANDIAINPTMRQRDQLYRIGINPVTQFPSEGIVVFGQKTLQKKPSAFDRVNVRRLFLDLEKRTKETLKFFIFEPNTFLTRTKVVNTLTPIFENCKQTEGVYDYKIVCDERNNTSATIENNELIVDIYLKPVRAAEFILVNFFSVNNDVNFEEIIG